MKAFHSDPAIKRKYVSRVERHRAADRLVQGIGAEGVGREFRGCAVGCTLNKYSHSAYEHELGVPQVLARLEDRIFEGLTKKLAMEWPSRFLKAIPVGADLSGVWPRFAHWLLVDETRGVLRLAKTDRSRDAIRAVAALFERQIAGGIVERSEWEAARGSAYAADAADAYAYAAYAADAADAADAYAAAYAADAADAAADAAVRSRARHAHYAAMSEKLIDLLKAAK